MHHDAIRYHHERIDGNGYPDSIAANNLPLSARVIAIADAFDAMTSTRAYRKGMTRQVAVERLLEARGAQFDSELVDLFVSLAGNGNLDEVLSHSDENIPLLVCEHCGQIIAVDRESKDGDIVYCQACCSEYRLQRIADTFALEPTGGEASVQQLKPQADKYPVEELIQQMPVELKF